MPEFHYTARDSDGQKVTGTLLAAGRREAAATLSARAVFPLEIRDAAPAVAVQKIRRIPAQLQAVTFGQLADLLRSGVPLLRALEVVEKQTSHAGLRQVLGEVRHAVEQGASLAEALARFPRIFGEMAVNMVRAGGEGGFLEEALSRIADFTEAQDDLKKRTFGAVIYPIVLAVVGGTIVTVLLVFFVPMFREFFARLDERNELPALTKGLLGLSDTLRSYGLIILAAAAGGVFFLRRKLGTESGRLWRDRMKLRVPLGGPIFQQLAVARFCRVLGTLLRNGVPILRSLEIAREATGNRILGAAIGEAMENVTAGQALAGPLEASGQFPPAVVEMIAVAEQANNLETVLTNIADTLEKRMWRKLDIAVRLLEPLLLIVMAGLVLLMTIALMLPILKMSQTIG
ncbi:MAG: type II secretion system F family protein [Pirellulales bacterium]|nr:type II secretion system F family protein [Pirellulales bacterium]